MDTQTESLRQREINFFGS